MKKFFTGTVIGEMFMIWLAWKIINTLIKMAVTMLPVPVGFRNAVVGG